MRNEMTERSMLLEVKTGRLPDCDATENSE